MCGLHNDETKNIVFAFIYFLYIRFLLVGFAVPTSLLSDSPLRIPTIPITSSLFSIATERDSSSDIIPQVRHDPEKSIRESRVASRISQVTFPSSVNHQMTKQQREIWVQINLPTAVQLQLDEPYGKDTQAQSFYGELQFRHTLIFVLKSGFLDSIDRNVLFSSAAYPKADLLYQLLQDHRAVDFTPLRHPIPSTLSDPIMMRRWGRMFTACLLFYNLDVATAIRYCGGAHMLNYLWLRQLSRSLEIKRQ
jgi:hypothetical protein